MPRPAVRSPLGRRRPADGHPATASSKPSPPPPGPPPPEPPRPTPCPLRGHYRAKAAQRRHAAPGEVPMDTKARLWRRRHVGANGNVPAAWARRARSGAGLAVRHVDEVAFRGTRVDLARAVDLA